MQTVGLAQRIAQVLSRVKTRLFQPRRDADVPPGCRTARWGIGLELVLPAERGADRRSWRRASGRKIEACGSWPSGPLARCVVISAEPGVDSHAVLLLQVEESERWHGFSGAGSGSSKPHEQGECGQLKHVSSKCQR
ncbi:hypothetical protein J4733_20645 [Klebsiella pneumoniae]|uniref:Uncharacterized protein n=1 Tax=Klebsiella pneumoniae TaxID=573 RepID=A0A939NLW3_KLEPN|nr:hypothetical protein [Klebsiella pneumoniae]